MARRRWSDVRQDFLHAPQRVHFDAMLVASPPKVVRDAIERHRNGLDLHPYEYVFDNYRALEERVLKAAARHLGVDPAQIARVESTSMGIALLYNGISVRPDQEILTTWHAEYFTGRALAARAQKDGVVIKKVRLYRDSYSASAKEILRNIDRAIASRTRVIALTWVHSNTGVKLPIQQISKLVRKANRGRAEGERILLCVDGVHGFGVENSTFAELGCDFLASGCHKWLFGPRGTGIVCGRKAAWKHVSPTIPSFSGDITPGRKHTPGGIHCYEHWWAVAEAFDYHLSLGKYFVQRRTHYLARLLKEGLSKLKRVDVRTPLSEDLSAGIVCFDLEGLSAREVVENLANQGIVATVSSTDIDGGHHVRFSVSVLNDEEQVDQALGELARM